MTPGSLSGRLALALTGVAMVSALLTAALAAPLLSGATQDAVRDPLARQADLLARIPGVALDSARVDRVTERADLSLGVVTAGGDVQGAAVALSAEQRAELLRGGSVSAEGELDGVRVLIEARPSRAGGGVVLAADASVVDTTSATLRRRVLLAVSGGLVVAVGVALLLAGRLGRPLRETAAAARRMAAGERGVPLPAPSTREIADVTDALGVLDAALATSEGRQRDFLLSVSHELRTPLTAVRGYGEALADGLVPADELASVGVTLVGESERMERYVSDLLALARLQADDYSVHLTPVDLDGLVRAAAAAWEERSARAGVRLSVTASPVDVVTDGSRIRQVLDALLDNSLRVCPSGAVVVLSLEPLGAGARLEVRDSGPGLTERDAADAFEPGVLHQRYRATRAGGQGLGLAIARRLITRLGGEMRVTTAPEGGAAFVIELPGRAPI